MTEDGDSDDDTRSMLSGSDNLDVCKELEAALKTKLQCSGQHVFYNRSSTAPNPILQLPHLGTIGLPFSSSFAEFIVKSQTFVRDRPTNDTMTDRGNYWEVDPGDIEFVQPQWPAFVDNTMKNVCRALGVSLTKSQPLCQLRNLAVLGTGDSPVNIESVIPVIPVKQFLFKLLKYSAVPANAFARMMIVLPSEYQGGESYFDYSNLTTTVHVDTAGMINTTVIAWYTEVHHEIKPIHTGYMLYLLYDLIQTTSAPLPTPPNNDIFRGSVTRALRLWKRVDESMAPEKIVYLLRHRYDAANLKASALEDDEGARVAELARVARGLGFHLGLGHVVYHVSAYIPDWDRSGREEIADTDTTFDNLVDMEGNEITQYLSIDDDPYGLCQTIPTRLEGALGGGPCIKEKDADSVERWYHNTVLVIWPEENDLIVRYSGNFPSACAALERRTAEQSSDEDNRLVEFIFTHIDESPVEVATAICHTAVRWGDPALWSRAVSSSHFWSQGKPVLSLDDLSKGISTLDFSKIAESVDAAFRSSPHTSGRIYFLKAVDDCLGQQPENQLLSAWRQSRVEETLEDLRKPTDADVDWIVSSAISVGGSTQLEKCIVPQLLEKCSSKSLIAFATRIHSLADDELRLDSRNEIVSLLMTSAVSKANFSRTINQPSSSSNSRKSQPHHPNNLAAAKHCLHACMDLGCLDLLSRVFKKVANIKDLQHQDAKDHAQEVMVPFLTYGHPLLCQKSEQIWQECAQKVAKVAVPLYLECVAGYQATKEDIRTLLQVTLWGEKELIAARIVPRFQQKDVPATNQLFLADELDSNPGSLDLSSVPDLRSVVISLARAYSKHAPYDSCEDLIDGVQNCHRLRVPEARKTFIDRVLAGFVPAKEKARIMRFHRQREPEYFPCVLPLAEFAHKGGFIAELAPLFKVILSKWAKCELRGGPDEDELAHLAKISQWSHDCNLCRKVLEFLRSTNFAHTNLSLGEIGSADQQHLEKLLARYAGEVASWSVRQRKMQISMDSYYREALQWMQVQSEALLVLRAISTDEDVLKRFFGSQYREIVNALRIKRVNERSADTPSSTPGSSRQNADNDLPGPPPTKKRRIASSTTDIIDLT